MTILLSDARVSATPVDECGEAVVELPSYIGAGSFVRRGVAERLLEAGQSLPDGHRLRVVEGHRSTRSQRAIIDRYSGELRTLNPGASSDRIRDLSGRFVAPLAVAPHVAAAAVDLTIVGPDGQPLDMGTAIDATPEASHGACFFGAPNITETARRNRSLLASALDSVGMINYPTEWWHWSFGDRYWALATGAPHALYGPVDRDVAP